ncbi:MAG TPA: hypothetical protein VIM22_01775, partial [Solirubrobacteraceae bacterium]
MLRGAVEDQANQPDPASGAGVGEQSTSLPATLAARIEEIVRAAEREAGVVQRDLEEQRRIAETEARRYLIDAKRQADALTEQRVGRLGELTGELVERAEAAQRQLEGLISAIERATAHADREVRQPDFEPPPAPRVPDPPRAGTIQPPPARPPDPGPSPAQAPPAQPVPDNPRLPPITWPPRPGEG